MPDETIEQEVQVTEPTEAEVQPEADAQPEEQQEGLPEDASERTKREFEKLKKHNEQLAKQLAEKEANQPPRPSLLDQFVPQTPKAMPQVPPVTTSLSQAQTQEIAKQLWDEEGTIDGNELQRRLSLAEQAEARARDAEAKAQAALERVARFEVEGQKKQLYEQYPELDPSNPEFNEEAYELVRNEMVNQLWETGNQNPVGAAKKMSKYWRKQEVPQQQKEAQQARRAVQSSASGKASSSASGDYEDLRKRSLYNKEAMEERIRRAGI